MTAFSSAAPTVAHSGQPKKTRIAAKGQRSTSSTAAQNGWWKFQIAKALGPGEHDVYVLHPGPPVTVVVFGPDHDAQDRPTAVIEADHPDIDGIGWDDIWEAVRRRYPTSPVVRSTSLLRRAPSRRSRSTQNRNAGHPDQTSPQSAALRASIEQEGITVPILLDQTNAVIDGERRIQICEELGFNWRAAVLIVVTKSPEHREALRKQINALRRDGSLRSKERHQLAAELLRSNPSQSDQSIASICGFERSTICKLRKGLVKSHKLQPQLSTVGVDGVERVTSSDKRRRKHKTSFYVPSRTSEKALETFGSEIGRVGERAKSGSAFVIHKAVRRQIRQLARDEQNEKAIDDYKALPVDDSLFHCKFQDLELDEKCDLVLTDPLWQCDQTEQWAALAKCAEKWLKPEGIFAVFFGGLSIGPFLRAVYPYWGDPQVSVIIYHPHNNKTDRIHFVISRHKHVFLFAKQTIVFKDHPFPTVYVSPAPEKDHHDYQRSLDTFVEMVLRLSQPNELVLDPCMGSGTTGVACHMADRRFIGCDCDEAAYATARLRIEKVRSDDREKVS